jgi:hypothetical protein
VRLWSVAPPGARAALTGQGGGAFRSVAWSPANDRVVAQAGRATRTCVWTARGELTVSFVHTDVSGGASYFADADALVIAGEREVVTARIPRTMRYSEPTRAGERVYWERRDPSSGLVTGPARWRRLVSAPPGASFIASNLAADRTALALGLSDGRVWTVLLPHGDPLEDDLPGDELGRASATASAPVRPRELTIAPDVPESVALSADARWLVAAGARPVLFDLVRPR